MSIGIIATEKPSIVVALPIRLPPEGVPNRFVKFIHATRALIPTHDVTFSFPLGEYDAHAMNLMVDEFRLDPANEWLFLWDPKIPITPEHLAKLVSCRVGVVGALVSDEREFPQWRGSLFPDMKADERGLLALPELDVGAKLFHRTVFDVVENKNPDLRYIFDQSGRSLVAFFQEGIVTFGEYQRMLRPAYFLDSLCRGCDVMVFAHVGVLICEGKEPYRYWEHTRLPPPECAEELPEVPHDPRPIMVCLQSCAKDATSAKTLWTYLTSTRNTGHEFQLFESTVEGYPKGPNQQARDIFDVAHSAYKRCKAVLLIEPDCVPVQKDWLEQLSNSWDRAAAAGKLIMGSWHPINVDHPTLGHINGNLMFSPDLAKRVTIPDVPDKIPWDTFLADVFQPHWCRTGLIKNLNRHRTATRAQMTKPECGNKMPVLIHGIRDDSAWNLAKENFSK